MERIAAMAARAFSKGAFVDKSFTLALVRLLHFNNLKIILRNIL